MFDFDELEHFYNDEYFNSEATRYAWFRYCNMFLTCVNGDWLKAINPSNARNQVYMYRYITPSDEAFVRWVLEVKRSKLLDEKEQGWPVAASGGKKKPSGMHDSRQFSHKYAEIYSDVLKKRKSSSSNQWNHLYWSIFRLGKPDLFMDPSSVACQSMNGTIQVMQPDEDEYEPENQKIETIIIFNEEDAEKSKYLEKIKSITV
jgi:hypothetical protein